MACFTPCAVFSTDVPNSAAKCRTNDVKVPHAAAHPNTRLNRVRTLFLRVCDIVFCRTFLARARDGRCGKVRQSAANADERQGGRSQLARVFGDARRGRSLTRVCHGCTRRVGGCVLCLPFRTAHVFHACSIVMHGAHSRRRACAVANCSCYRGFEQAK